MSVTFKVAGKSKSEIKRLEAQEAAYLAELHEIVDQIFNKAYEFEWIWHRLAREACLADGTVDRLGDRTTRYPLLRTVLKLAKAVKLQVSLTAKPETVKLSELLKQRKAG